MKGGNYMAEFMESLPSELEDQRKDVIYKIANYPADFTLQGLYDKYLHKDIDIPTFQRRFVWKIVQSSKLIESFLLGLPVPGIFLYKDKQSQQLLVIDGQQRLRTVFGYFDGIFPDSKRNFRLKDVDGRWEGKSFLDLDEPDKRRLKDSVLRAIIVEQLDPNDNTSIFHIFQRLNTGSTVLNPQEIRNCLYHGKFSDLLNELNKSPQWRKIIDSPIPDSRMRDIELILRFLALTNRYKQYESPMKDFLSNFMNDYKNDEIKITEFRKTFEDTVNTIYGKLSSRPFVIKTGLQAAVFDSIMVAFALNLDKIPQNIKERHEKLLKDNEYIELVYKFTTAPENVRKRIEMATEKLFY
jgi:uncharacterized protein with ParB-like and HNH nuclease domain